MENYKDLKISNHFLGRCKERAPWLMREIKQKYGGGYKLNLPVFCEAVKNSKEIKRPKTITTLLKYGYKTKYYHFDKVPVKRQLIFVVEGDVLKTLYLYRYSWAANKIKEKQ